MTPTPHAALSDPDFSTVTQHILGPMLRVAAKAVRLALLAGGHTPDEARHHVLRGLASTAGTRLWGVILTALLRRPASSELTRRLTAVAALGILCRPCEQVRLAEALPVIADLQREDLEALVAMHPRFRAVLDSSCNSMPRLAEAGLVSGGILTRFGAELVNAMQSVGGHS